MRRECSVNWRESGNGNSCFRLQFAQSVRDTTLAHEKGLLENLETIVAQEIFNSAGKSLLRCSKGRVSVFFASAAQYIEVDASNGKFACWNVALPPIAGERATGFAVTEEARILRVS